MPTYDYECAGCGKSQERFFKIADMPRAVDCECGQQARKVLSAGMVLGDEMPAWMRHKEVLGCLQNSAERPIQSRSEYNRYLKTRGIAEVSAGREI